MLTKGERVLATNDITDKMAKITQYIGFSQTHLEFFSRPGRSQGCSVNSLVINWFINQFIQ